MFGDKQAIGDGPVYRSAFKTMILLYYHRKSLTLKKHSNNGKRCINSNFRPTGWEGNSDLHREFGASCGNLQFFIGFLHRHPSFFCGILLFFIHQQQIGYVLYVWVRVSFKGLCDVLGMNSAY